MKNLLPLLTAVVTSMLVLGGTGRVALHAQAANGASLVSNGNLEADSDNDQWPDGWPKAKTGGSWVEEQGNHFIRLKSSQPGEMVMLYRQITVPKGVKALQFTWRWRVSDFKPGAEAWFDARILMDFKDASGTKLPPAPSAPYRRNNTNGWVEASAKLNVPEGATFLEIMPSLIQVEQGMLDLDDVAIKPVD